MKITVFGTGYVGLVTGSCLANLGHNVICVDIDAQKISSLEKGIIPFYEPGLKDLVTKNQEKRRLSFTTDIQQGITFGDVYFNCVGTPGRDDGNADLQYVFTVAENIGRYAHGHKLLINKSTVPPGTARRCYEIITTQNPETQIEVVSNPEFLAEGKAVYDFTHPDKIVLGAMNHAAYATMHKVYTGRLRTYIPFLETDWETAEMIKYAQNSFLATKISFINEIANICDKIGADVKLVAQAMGLDYRINPRFLNPGVGYGGSCFPKDIRALVKKAEQHHYDARLLKEVDALNKRQQQLITQKIKDHFGELSGKNFTIWGLSFKPNTSDIRESPAIKIIPQLLDQGAHIHVYDPIALDEVRSLFADRLTYHSSLSSSVINSHAIIVLTEWDDFRNVNFAELGRTMHSQVLFDGRNIYEPELVKEEGFIYYGVGRR